MKQLINQVTVYVMSMQTPAAYYAALEPDTDRIVGLGTTPEGALVDGARWTEKDTDELRTAPCTKALAERVQEEDGPVRYTERDGVLDVE